MSDQTPITAASTKPQTGGKVDVSLTMEGDDEPIYAAQVAVDDAPADPSPENPFQTHLLTEAWKTPELRALHQEPPSDELMVASVKDGLDVSKFIWDIIKDNKPSAKGAGTMTTVLAEGTKPLDYVSAKVGQTKALVLSVKDAMWPHPEYIRVRFRLEGSYAATPAKPDTPKGHYLPSVYFNVLECWATWPTWVEASAEVAGPYDLGTATNRQPQIKLYAKFHYGWIGSGNNLTCGFVADGARGLGVLGWQ